MSHRANFYTRWRQRRWLDQGYRWLGVKYPLTSIKTSAHLRDEAAICRLGGESKLADLLDLCADLPEEGRFPWPRP